MHQIIDIKSLCVVTILLVTTPIEGARILIFQPTPAKGHVIVTNPLFEELASRGHNLTLVTSFPHNPPLPNLHEIDVSSKFPSLVNNLTLDVIQGAMPNQFMSPIFMTDTEHSACEEVYTDDRVRRILQSNETFDLVMTEMFTNDCFVPFAYKFKAPLISFVTSCALPWVADRVGLPDNPSYIPNYFMDAGSEMSFRERLYNTMFLIYTKLLYYYKILPKTQLLVNSYFEKSVPPISEIVRNTSLILVNSYFPLATTRPFSPNVIEIGGIHLSKSAETMPQDLLELLDRSSQGVLVVSFGSMVRVASLPGPVIRTFLACFAKLRQTVIFKYEEDLLDVPKNVVIRQWLPQREIIGHKHVKAVLLHGGLSSTTEAAYFGKPMIGIPFFSDQFLNIKTVARRGAGIMMALEEVTEQKLDFALNEVLNNPMYTEKAKELSAQFRDRPMSPLDTAVFWTEYVLRHRGAPQLRPASVDLGLWRYLLLDVVAFFLVIILVLFYTVYYVSCRVFRMRTRNQRDNNWKKYN